MPLTILPQSFKAELIPKAPSIATLKKDEIPVFWACGVTPQLIAMNSKPPLMITHSPGHMFITDIVDEDLAIF